MNPVGAPRPPVGVRAADAGAARPGAPRSDAADPLSGRAGTQSRPRGAALSGPSRPNGRGGGPSPLRRPPSRWWGRSRGVVKLKLVKLLGRPLCGGRLKKIDSLGEKAEFVG